ncbi:MAG TPA: hypothetical protein VF365_12965 [Candidatus Limnocylindria bacterium]
MARDHARLFTSIWADPDFRRLKAAEQHAYFTVLSDNALTHCGTGILTVKRWTGQSAGMTERAFRRSLDVLEEHRYLVNDWDTDEVLVRSLLRRDKVFRLPNVAKSAYTTWKSLHSPRVRAEVLFEVHRIHEGPASDRTDKSFDDEYVADWLQEPLPEGLPEGFLKGFEEGSPDGFAQPIPKGFLARVHSARSIAITSSKAPDSATPPPKGWRPQSGQEAS